MKSLVTDLEFNKVKKFLDLIILNYICIYINSGHFNSDSLFI